MKCCMENLWKLAMQLLKKNINFYQEIVLEDEFVTFPLILKSYAVKDLKESYKARKQLVLLTVTSKTIACACIFFAFPFLPLAYPVM